MTDISADTAIATGSSIARTLANRFSDTVNVLDFGAIIGSSAPDNKSFIDDAISYATENNNSVYFPSGIYNTSGSHTVSPSMGLLLAGEALFSAVGGGTDGFIFSAGNYRSGHKIGALTGFSGHAVWLQDANLLGLDVSSIGGCGWGIDLEVIAGSVLNNTISFGVIYSCQTGGAIRLRSTLSNATFQGNVIKGNFLDGNAKAIRFELPSGDNNCNLNEFYIAAIDGTGGTSSSGITYNTSGNAPNQTYFDVPGFFGGFSGLWIQSGNVNRFRVSVQGNTTYPQWSLIGVGIVVENIYEYTNSTTPTPAATTSNQATTWNGGIPYPFKQLTISLVVTALASGETIDFYIYHPFTCGYTQMFRGKEVAGQIRTAG